MNDSKVVLDVENISVKFRMYSKGLRQYELTVINNLNIRIHEGEVLAIVGSSGSGKSVLAHAILGILPSNAIVQGSIQYMGEELTKVLQKKKVGSEIIMIPQSLTYLDPLMKIGRQVQGVRGTKLQQEKAFERYRLEEKVAHMYPYQLSGGMARRVLISTAAVTDAKLILADEPTPGLSNDLAKQTMEHFRELADEGKSILMITHDIDIALEAADTIVVFKDGQSIDQCTKEQFLQGSEELTHPYTRALWEALPQNGFITPDSRI